MTIQAPNVPDNMKLRNPMLTALMMAAVTVFNQRYGHAGVAVMNEGAGCHITTGDQEVTITIEMKEQILDEAARKDEDEGAEKVRAASEGLYNEDRAANPSMPAWEELDEKGRGQYAFDNITRLVDRVSV